MSRDTEKLSRVLNWLEETDVEMPEDLSLGEANKSDVAEAMECSERDESQHKEAQVLSEHKRKSDELLICESKRAKRESQKVVFPDARGRRKDFKRSWSESNECCEVCSTVRVEQTSRATTTNTPLLDIKDVVEEYWQDMKEAPPRDPLKVIDKPQQHHTYNFQ